MLENGKTRNTNQHSICNLSNLSHGGESSPAVFSSSSTVRSPTFSPAMFILSSSSGGTMVVSVYSGRVPFEVAVDVEANIL